MTDTITLNWTQGTAGSAIYFRLLRNNVQVNQQNTSWSYSLNENATSNTTTFTNVVSYNTGSILNNTLGLPDDRGRILTGSKSTSRSFIGYYRRFYGAVATLPSNLRNLPANSLDTDNIVLQPPSKTTPAFYAGENIQCIAIPATKSLLTVITEANENITANFTSNVSAVHIRDANNNPIAYKLYRNTTITPLNLNITTILLTTP